MTDLVVRLHASHHTGVYRRAGFTFGYIPQTISVDDEARDIILNDIYLITSQSEVKEVTEELTRKQIIAQLKEKGLVQGKDFSHMSKKTDLMKLL